MGNRKFDMLLIEILKPKDDLLQIIFSVGTLPMHCSAAGLASAVTKTKHQKHKSGGTTGLGDNTQFNTTQN